MYCQHCMQDQKRKGRFCIYCGKDLTAQNAPHQLPVGTRLQDRYVVGAAIGQGGFGITYVGLDLRIRKKIAIKEYFPRGLVDRREGDTDISVTAGTEKVYFDKEKKRFLQEAEILAKFSGERNIVGISDNFEEHNTVYIVMEFIDGIRLDEYLEQQGKLPFEKLFRLFSPLMQSLSRVHSTGLIHRDISPQNIMVLPDETLILLDFGAAREYGESKETSLSVILKHGYSPSEQYMSHGRQGPWTDVYALCATMYRMLTTVMPPTAVERMASDKLEKPSKLGAEISPAEEEVLLHGMALDIENRIQSMEELHREFESASEKGRAYRYRGKNPQKKSGKAGLAALFLIPLLLAGVGAFLFFGGKKDDAAVSVIGADAEEEWDEEDSSGKAGEQAAAKKADIPEGFTVEEHPILRSADSTYYNDCFGVENNSGKNVKAELICNAYDAEGNLLESKTGKLDPLGDKEKSYVYAMFSDKEHKIDHVDYSLLVSDTDAVPALSSLKVTEQDTGKGIVVTAEHTGEEPLASLQMQALFLNENGEAVLYSSANIAGAAGKLRKGEIWSAAVACSKPYSSVQYALTGKKEQDNGKQPVISPELFSVECQDGIFKSTCYPVVTNRSDKNATVKVNAVAHGEDGAPVFAGTGEIYAIGPGETTVVPVLLTNSLPDGRLEFRVSAAETDNRRSAIADLVLETRKESKSVLTAITNYGSGTAESVHIFALFRDAEGNLVHARDEWLVASMELGASKIIQIDSPKEFDHADFYVSGYKTGLEPGPGLNLRPSENEPSKLAGAVYEKPKAETIIEGMDMVWGTLNKGEGAENFVFFINKELDFGGYYRVSSGRMSGSVGKLWEGSQKEYMAGDTPVTLQEYVIEGNSEGETSSVFIAIDGGKAGQEDPPGGPSLLQLPDMEEDHAETISENDAARQVAVNMTEFFFGSY